MKRKNILFFAILTAILLLGCSKQEYKITSTGVKYEVLKEGTGPAPQRGDKVTVHYTGWLEDGKKFDSSVDRNTPFSFRLGVGEVIQGWDDGVATMMAGGKTKFIIPSELAYGTNGIPGSIPPNATLIFDIELIAINK